MGHDEAPTTCLPPAICSGAPSARRFSTTYPTAATVQGRSHLPARRHKVGEKFIQRKLECRRITSDYDVRRRISKDVHEARSGANDARYRSLLERALERCVMTELRVAHRPLILPVPDTCEGELYREAWQGAIKKAAASAMARDAEEHDLQGVTHAASVPEQEEFEVKAAGVGRKFTACSQVPWCIMGCGVGHTDTIAHYVCGPCIRERLMPLRQWRFMSLREGLGFAPDVEAEARASVEGVRRVGITTLGYHSVGALWAAGGCRRNSGVADS